MMLNSRLPLGGFALGLAGLTLLGCGPDFTPYWKVERLRVMAIQADPVVAKPGELVTLSALVHAPDDAEVEYQWSWCPFQLSAQDDFQCPVSAEDLAELFEELDEDFADSDIFDLGTEPQALFLHPFEPEEIQAFCELIQREIIEATGDPEMARFLPGGDCTQGYEVSVRLQVTAGDRSLTSAKRFTLWGGNEEFNRNPRVTDLQLRPADPDDLGALRDRAGWDIPVEAEHHEQWLSIDPDVPLVVLGEIPMEMRALVDRDSLQIYTPPAPVGADESEQPAPRLESLVYRYFTTFGQLDQSYLLFVPDRTLLEDASITEIEFRPDEEADEPEECQHPTEEGCLTRIWTTVRDSRLGVDWIGRQVLVVER